MAGGSVKRSIAEVEVEPEKVRSYFDELSTNGLFKPDLSNKPLILSLSKGE